MTHVRCALLAVCVAAACKSAAGGGAATPEEARDFANRLVAAIGHCDTDPGAVDALVDVRAIAKRVHGASDRFADAVAGAWREAGPCSKYFSATYQVLGARPERPVIRWEKHRGMDPVDRVGYIELVLEHGEHGARLVDLASPLERKSLAGFLGENVDEPEGDWPGRTTDSVGFLFDGMPTAGAHLLGRFEPAIDAPDDASEARGRKLTIALRHRDDAGAATLVNELVAVVGYDAYLDDLLALAQRGDAGKLLARAQAAVTKYPTASDPLIVRLFAEVLAGDTLSALQTVHTLAASFGLRRDVFEGSPLLESLRGHPEYARQFAP